MKLRKWLLIIVLVMSGEALVAQQALSLEDALAKALENNYDLSIADLDLEIAKNNNNWGTVGGYPSVETGATNINRFDDDTQGQRTMHAIAPYLSVNYAVFNGFSARINKEKLETLEHLSEGNARLLVENTMQAVILAYYRVLLAKEQLQVLDDVRALSRDRYNYEQERKAMGNAVTFDVLQSKTAYLEDSSNYILQKNNYRNALRNLNQLMAEEVGKEYRLTGAFLPAYQEYDLAKLEEWLLVDNRNLRNQYIQQEILRKDVELEKSALYPMLRLSSGIDYNSARINPDQAAVFNEDEFSYYANFTLSFNLYDGGKTRRAIQNARIEEQIGTIEQKEMADRLRRNLRNTYELYEARKQVFDVALDREETAKLNLGIAEDRFKAGTINSFNYRDIQLVYLNAALSKAEAVFNLIDTQTELMRLTGNIAEEY
ncbi:MAG: TolC family protein [Bacteroidota bacterium]